MRVRYIRALLYEWKLAFVLSVKFVYVLVIRRKDDVLTDIVSNEARRAEFDTISVRPSSFRRITNVKHWKLLTKQLS